MDECLAAAGLEDKGTVKVRHLFEAIYIDIGVEAIKSKVVKPLSGLKVAPYYGCLMVRPPEVAGLDNPENPVYLDRLIDAMVGVGLDWPYKVEFCGGSLTLTVRDLAAAMIDWSDNTATNRLIAMLGRERVNRTMDDLGFPKTRLMRAMMDSAAAARDEENVSTPAEMARLMESIWSNKAAGVEDCREIIEILKLPDKEMKSAVPDGVEVAAKAGVLDGVRCETGIVFLERRPFALAIMTAYLDRGLNPVPEVTGLVYRHFDKVANANRFGRRLR